MKILSWVTPILNRGLRALGWCSGVQGLPLAHDEDWLEKNPKALNSVLRGLQQSKEGKVKLRKDERD